MLTFIKPNEIVFKLLSITYYGGQVMVSIKDIPAEVRWEIATKSATAMSFAYGAFLERALGDKSDEIVKQIWIEGGKEAKALAEKLDLPVGNARDVDETWGVLSLILYGPEFTGRHRKRAKTGPLTG